jgi:hypothetical protein
MLFFCANRFHAPDRMSEKGREPPSEPGTKRIAGGQPASPLSGRSPGGGAAVLMARCLGPLSR